MSTLETWRFDPDGGDWADVLSRAERRRVPRWAIIAAAGLLAALAGPAVAVVTQAIGREGGGPRLTATLRGPAGTAGTLTVFVRHTFLVTSRGGPGARIFVPKRRGRDARVPLTWELGLRQPGEVTSLRLLDRRGGRIATLCAPCTAGTGRTTIPLWRAKFLFQPRASVAGVVDGSTLTGPLVLRR